MLKKDRFLSEFVSIINDDFNQDNKTFKDKYNCVRSKYEEKLSNKSEKEKVEFIKLEKYRIENIKFSIESNTNGLITMGLILLITIIVTVCTSMDAFNDDIRKVEILTSYGAFIVIYQYLHIKDKASTVIYDLAIKVLQDIEHEINEEEKQMLECSKLEVATDKENKTDEILENTEQIKKFLGI